MNGFIFTCSPWRLHGDGLTLLFLLILSSDGNVSSLSSRTSRHVRDAELNVDHGKLKWKWMQGNSNLPDGAVAIYNDYAKRTEYVCRNYCHCGFYSPSLDSECHTSFYNKEVKKFDFEVLVNEDDFESLQWEDGSYGSVPQNSVRTCEDEEIYVGKTKYGLGKVHPMHEAFFIPYGGGEHWHKHYQVLTVNKDVESNFMTDIRYNIDYAKIVSYPPETMLTSAVINYDCNQATKSVTLSKTIQEEKRWDLSSSITLGARTEFSVGIPLIVEAKVEISASATFQASGGHSRTEINTQTVTVTLSVPPNHSCRVRMVGYKYETDIPFTARFRRSYRNGKTAWTSISGKYNSVQVGEVNAVVEQCTPVDNPSTCP